MTIKSAIKGALLRVQALLPGHPDRFLRHVTGVIHVGANTGQERALYAAHDLDVIWIEPIPSVFDQLQANIAGLPRQRAIRGLVTDSDGMTYAFHVASNNGQSSSILPFKHHLEVWPHIRYEGTVELTGETLPSILQRHGLDASGYQALVLDTQGSELLVLHGASPMLRAFRYIKVEASDFEIYEGCCLLSDVSAFLAQHGFTELSRHCFAEGAGGGRCFDVVFARRAG